jgi:phage portal protein BeeE
LINYRGALGVLSADPGKGQFTSMPLGEPQKEQLQKDFRRYGLRNKQWQVILTTASLKWQQMGYATKDLMLLEEVQESTKSLCDGLNFPPHLLGLIDPTFNNQKDAKKGLYEDGIIPDAESYYEQLSAWFQLDRFPLIIEKDFSHIPALQADQVQQATARKFLNEALTIEWETGLITLNEWRLKLGEDPLSDERGKLYYDEYQKTYGTKQPAQTTNQQGTTGSEQTDQTQTNS